MEKITKPKWKDKTLTGKIISIVGIIISFAVIILAILHLIGVNDRLVQIYEPLLGVLMLIQAAENWKYERRLAVFSLIVAVVIFICAAVILLLA